MNRVTLSGIGGVFIPLSYCLIIFPLLDRIHNETILQIVRAPLELPTRIYDYFYPEPNAWYPSQGWFIALYLGNFILYALLTYAFLIWRNIPRRLP